MNNSSRKITRFDSKWSR